MTLASPDRALATMAMIDANARRGKTHLDNFVPFALEALRVANGKPQSPGEVATAVATDFGLRVPIHAMESVLRRAVREKAAVRDSNRYTLKEDSPAPLKNLKADQQRFLREQASLCTKFVAYCSDVHSVDISVEDAEIALYDQIERNTIALLSAELTGEPYSQAEQIEVEHHFLAADFIAYVTKSDQTAYEWLVTAAKGATLSAVLHLPNELQVNRKFSSTDLYLDAPLLLKLAGLEGEEAEQSAIEVIRSARSYGANIMAFTHSVTEAEGVIGASAEARRRGRSMPRRSDGVLAYAIRMDLGATELQLAQAKFSSIISSLGVTIRDRPDSIEYLEIDELGLTGQLREAISYRYDGALYKDVDSLRGIHFIRRGRSSTFIEDSRAVLITDNEAVARVARRFFRSEGYGWPIATLISDLATLLYIKEPQKSPELPRLQMVAGAYSALEPGASIWNSWLETVENMKKSNTVTRDDVALLCHTEESRRILMQVTLGNPSKVTTETVQEVLTETRRRVAAPYEEKARAHETESIKASANAHVMSTLASKAKEELRDVRSTLGDLKTENETYRVIELERRSSIKASAERFASRWTTGILVSLVLVTGGWAILSLTGVLPSTHLSVIIAVTATAGVVFAILQQMFGGDVRRWVAPLERLIARRRTTTLSKITGVDISSEHPNN